MIVGNDSNAERFLMIYRELERALEKRYAEHAMGSFSIIMEYLHDPDSLPYRTELDLCREIRNLLSHNADRDGKAVIQPSDDIIITLREILTHVQRPRLAANYGTPGDRIMFAHPNDLAESIMRSMRHRGFSHVPVRDKNDLIGIFSAESLFAFFDKNGFEAAKRDLRIKDLKDALDFGDNRSEKYMFLPADATLLTVRDAFDKRTKRNNRLAVVFITEDGTRNTKILRMLTPWDVLKDGA